MVLFALVAAVWGIASYFRKLGVDGNYWGILAVGELLFLAQGLVGVILWLGGGRPASGIHVVYGVLSVITLPAYYGLSKGQDDRRAALVYGLLCLVVAAMSFRAAATGA